MPHPPYANGYPLEPIKDASLEYLQAQLFGGGDSSFREPLQRHSFDEGTSNIADTRDTHFVPLRHSLQSSERFRPVPGAAAAKAAMTRMPSTDSEGQNSGSVNVPATSSRPCPTSGQAQGTGFLSFGQVREMLSPRRDLRHATPHVQTFGDSSTSPRRRLSDGNQVPVASCGRFQSLPPAGLSVDLPIASLTAVAPCILRPAPPSPRAVAALLAVPLSERAAQAVRMTHSPVRRQSQVSVPGCPSVAAKVMRRSASQEAFSSSHQVWSPGIGQRNTISGALQSNAPRFEVPQLAQVGSVSVAQQVPQQSVAASRQLSARRNTSASVPWSTPSTHRRDALISGIASGAPPPVTSRPRSPKGRTPHHPASRMPSVSSQAFGPVGAGGSVPPRIMSSPVTWPSHHLTDPQHPQHSQNPQYPHHSQHPQHAGGSHHSSCPHLASTPCQVSSTLPQQPAAVKSDQGAMAACGGIGAGRGCENHRQQPSTEGEAPSDIGATDAPLASTASTSASSASLGLTGTVEPVAEKAVIETFTLLEESLDSATNSRAWWQVLADGRAQRRDQRAIATAANAIVDEQSVSGGCHTSDSACIHDALGSCHEQMDPENISNKQPLSIEQPSFTKS